MENEIKDKKISFWEKLLISIKDFDQYKIFAIEKLSQSIKYIFQFVLLFVIIISFSFTIKYGMYINGVLNYIKGDLPEFTYENGKLNFNTEDVIEKQSNENTTDISYKFLINTKEVSEEEINKYKEKIGQYNYGIIFLNNKIIVQTSLGGTIEKTYKDLETDFQMPQSFNKKELLEFLNTKNLIVLYIELFTVMYFYLFISYFATILLDSILLAALAYVTARVVRVKLKFSGSYAIALHSLTLPIILNVIYIVVNTYTGFYIKYFNVMYTTISYIYVIAAILSIRSDLIKEQILIEKINNVGVGKSNNQNDNSNDEGVADSSDSNQNNNSNDEGTTDNNASNQTNNSNNDVNVGDTDNSNKDNNSNKDGEPVERLKIKI